MSDPDQIVIQCPSCGGRLRTPRSTVGTEVGCPSCQAAVTVRDPSVYAPLPMIVDPSRKLGTAPRSGNAPVTDASFKERLHRTTDSSYQVDPENPVMKRRDLRKAKHGDTLTDWETRPRAVQRGHRHARRFGPLLAGLAAILALVLAGIFWQRIQRPAPNPQILSEAAPASAAAGTLELKSPADYRGEIWEVVRQFCSAPTAEALLPFIREPERVGPLLHRYYTADNPWMPIAIGKKPDLSNLTVHRNFAVFSLPLADYGVRPVALEQTPQGFKIDWESFTGYSELPWGELRRTRPRRPVLVRAVLSPTDYFNFDFPKGSPWFSYKIRDLHGDHVLYGYVPVDSDLQVRILKMLVNAPSVHAVLRVRYPEKSTNDTQLEITEVLEKGWIFREDDDVDPELDVHPPALADPSAPAAGAPAPSRLLPGVGAP